MSASLQIVLSGAVMYKGGKVVIDDPDTVRVLLNVRC